MPRVRGLCSIDGCRRSHIARGMCDLHYRRWKKHGDPMAVRGRNKCAVEGCDRFCHGHGFCGTHLYRFQKYGDPMHLNRRPDNQTCEVDGCSTKALARGWCQLHYNRWARHGDPMTTLHGCAVCHRRDCLAIEAAILTGLRHEEISSKFDIGLHSVIYHSRRHMRISSAPVGRLCQVCRRPDVHEIDELIASGKSIEWLQKKYGISLRTHSKPGHFAKVAAREAARLADVLEWLA